MENISDPNLLEKILKSTFGFQEFRPGQQEAIQTLLHHGRLLCIQPTGHGKSLLYQLPTCILGGITLVISPLLALMRDQIKQLNERFNIPAAAINSDQTDEDNYYARKAAQDGKIKVLFIAPEQLDHIDRFHFLLNLDIRLVVIDEAHCISTWGHDFRPSYRQIIHLVKELTDKIPQLKILALTATADATVEEDIKRQLILSNKDVVVMRETMDRPNISLNVVKHYTLTTKLAYVANLLSSLEGCGLIYCATRENVELVTEFLQDQKLHVAAYHAGFEPEEKLRLQSEFIEDKYKALIATNALGMGIDKGNLRFIIHFDTPGSITAYYQEVGRCGRDRKPAQGFLIFCPSDKRIQEYFIDSAVPYPNNFEQVLQAIETATKSPNLNAIKRATGLHPTLVTTIIAELTEQEYIGKRSENGLQVYYSLNKTSQPDLSRYNNQKKVKTAELQKMIHYGEQENECRMALLRKALGDTAATRCNHCDVCNPRHHQNRIQEKDLAYVNEWLKNRPFPIPAMLTNKISAGMSALNSKMRTPLFVRFMKERNVISSYEEMDPELLQMLLRHLYNESKIRRFAGIIPIPSRTWKARDSMIHYIAQRLNLPVLNDLLFWIDMPQQRQGELLNNDQRHFNVHQKMDARPTVTPPGTLILFDDYIGSGNTIKEAGRALRTRRISNDLMPFTIASVKWHLGKQGFS